MAVLALGRAFGGLLACLAAFVTPASFCNIVMVGHFVSHILTSAFVGIDHLHRITLCAYGP